MCVCVCVFKRAGAGGKTCRNDRPSAWNSSLRLHLAGECPRLAAAVQDARQFPPRRRAEGKPEVAEHRDARLTLQSSGTSWSSSSQSPGTAPRIHESSTPKPLRCRRRGGAAIPAARHGARAHGRARLGALGGRMLPAGSSRRSRLDNLLERACGSRHARAHAHCLHIPARPCQSRNLEHTMANSSNAPATHLTSFVRAKSKLRRLLGASSGGIERGEEGSGLCTQHAPEKTRHSSWGSGRPSRSLATRPHDAAPGLVQAIHVPGVIACNQEQEKTSDRKAHTGPKKLMVQLIMGAVGSLPALRERTDRQTPPKPDAQRGGAKYASRKLESSNISGKQQSLEDALPEENKIANTSRQQPLNGHRHKRRISVDCAVLTCRTTNSPRGPRNGGGGTSRGICPTECAHLPSL